MACSDASAPCAQVRSFLQLPMEGVVLETYGTGNAPDNRPDLLAEMKEATDRGVIIINTTQCLRGTVSKVYATGEVGASVLAIREGILLNGSGVNGYKIVNE